MVRNYSDSQSSALCLTEHLPWNVSIESMLLRLMWHARGCDFSWRDAAIRVGNQEGCTGTGSVSAVSASKAIYTFTDPSSFISDCVCANGDALNAFYRAGSFTWWKYIIIHMIHIILWIGTFLVLGPLWLSTKPCDAEKVDDVLLLVWRLIFAFPPLADDPRSQPRCCELSLVILRLWILRGAVILDLALVNSCALLLVLSLRDRRMIEEMTAL